MTSSNGESQPRPEVVQALFSALVDMDPGELDKIAGTGITPAERRQAEDLFAATLAASLPQRERFPEAMRVLIGDRKLQEGTTWQELFDSLTPERAVVLEGLYDGLPDGARAEWDHRYGRPAAI
jgi:hypothetical protein